VNRKQRQAENYKKAKDILIGAIKRKSTVKINGVNWANNNQMFSDAHGPFFNAGFRDGERGMVEHLITKGVLRLGSFSNRKQKKPDGVHNEQYIRVV
jgi:hypothetical protein